MSGETHDPAQTGVLTIDDLVVRREGFTLAASARFAPGVSAVLGPSGAGKTTLMLAAAGLLTPDNGRVALGAETLSDAGTGAFVPAWRRGVGLVFQGAPLWPHRAVADIVRYGGRYREADVVRWCGIGQLMARRPRDLSGGEAQRVAIARAVMARPRCLLLDEPFSGVDPGRRRDLRELFATLARELAIPVVCVTHLVDEALSLASHLVLVDAGRVVAAGPPGEVLADPGAFPVADDLGLVSLLDVQVTEAVPDGGVVYAEVAGQRLTLPRAGAPEVGASGRVAVRPEDVLLSLGPLTGVSAQNALTGCVVGIVDVGDRALVHVDVGQPLRVEVTRTARVALALEEGLPVWAYAKTWAFRWRR